MSALSELSSILMALWPGFLCSSMLDVITVRPHKDKEGRIFEALSFSLLVSALLVVVGETLNRLGWPSAHIMPMSAQLPLISPSPMGILIAAVLAVCIAGLAGASINNDWHMSMLRCLGFSRRTARGTVWLDVFTDQRRYVTVHLSDGRRIYGWPMYYADTPEEGDLYLHDPFWIGDDGQGTPMGSHGVLVKAAMVELIEFWMQPQKNKVKEIDGDEHRNKPAGQ